MMVLEERRGADRWKVWDGRMQRERESIVGRLATYCSMHSARQKRVPTTVAQREAIKVGNSRWDRYLSSSYAQLRSHSQSTVRESLKEHEVSIGWCDRLAIVPEHEWALAMLIGGRRQLLWFMVDVCDHQAGRVLFSVPSSSIPLIFWLSSYIPDRQRYFALKSKRLVFDAISGTSPAQKKE